MKLMKLIPIALFASFTFTSCVEKNDIITDDTISSDVVQKISKLGFSTHDIKKDEDGGYIVEGDILLHDHDLDRVLDGKVLRVAEAEQYHTTLLVTGSPRVITISISNRLPSSYVGALDEAIRRYNAENLSLSFQRVSSGADISIVKGNGSFLASAGFPTSTGNPFNQVKVNSGAIGNGTSVTFTNYVATILAHEIGHCIGFRHTDYMGRQYSCGGSPVNEGASTVGAIQIPGTPSGPDAGSWMLACIGSNQSRLFNSNDKVALNFLY